MPDDLITPEETENRVVDVYINGTQVYCEPIIAIPPDTLPIQDAPETSPYWTWSGQPQP